MKNEIFEKALADVPNYIDLFARNSIDIIDEVHLILKSKGWTQKELAAKMGKSESEISKWLSGGHNITLKTVSKLEDVLNEKIIMTCSKARNSLSLDSVRANLGCLVIGVESFVDIPVESKSRHINDINFHGVTENDFYDTEYKVKWPKSQITNTDVMLSKV